MSKLSVIDDNVLTNEIANTLKKEPDNSISKKVPVILTSNLIESLIGEYKMIVKPHKLSEINKTILSIPCLCEKHTQTQTDKAFSKLTQKQTDFWIKRNIPKTILSRKKEVVDLIRKEASIIELKPKQKKITPGVIVWAF